MGALREKMVGEMKLRNFAARTQKSYLAVMVGLAKHYRQFPDQLTQEQVFIGKLDVLLDGIF